MTTAAVSIVGIGCRVPGAGGGDEFWRMLLARRDATGMPPDGRLGTRRGGYLDDIESFDNDWFALADRETARMDPRQRLAMAVAVEAIDDAGIGYRVKGSGGAVLFGACGYDHGSAALGCDGADAHCAVTGSGLSVIATQLSYVLDLHGPSMVLDSAGASSLAAVDLAVRLLVDETVPFAIVGGIDLTLLPYASDALAEGRFRAPDGCEPFDAGAEDNCRGEGCAVVILQRTEDAVRERNRVYAEIAGTAVGANGHSNSRHVPNGRAQQDTMRTAWSRAELDPRTAGYIECHAIGTSVGDEAEVGALAAVVAQGVTDSDKPIWIGSVTSNIGQLEAASGIIGMIKTALSIHHGVIAPTLGFHTENPLLKTAEGGLRVPTAPVDWSMVPRGERSAGVCSADFGGTNAHAVLRGVEAAPVAHGDESPVLIPITGRDTDELRAQALQFADQLELGDGSLRESAAAAARLLPERNRLCVLARDREDAVAQLRTVARGDSGRAVLGPSTTRRRGGVLFLFPGPGGQHLAMGRSLAARHSDFAAALARTADAITAAGGPRIWTPRHGFALAAGNGSSGNGPHAAEYVQPAIFAFQVAMAELLAAWGIRPDAVAGHGLGEVAAAVVSGALSLSDAALVVVRRSKSRPDLHAAMALLAAAPYEAAKLVEPMRAQVGIAAINGPRSVVVSGTARYIDTLVRRAKRRNMSALRIADDSAAYAPRIATVPPGFVEALADLRPAVPHTPMYSTVRRGELISTASLDGEYWSENASGTVELGAALERAAEDGLSTVLEVAPHPVLIPAVREHPEFHDAAHSVASRDDEAGEFLSCLSRLHLEGRPVDWSAQGPFTAAAPRREWRKRRFPLVAAVPEAAEEPFPADDLTDHVVQGAATVPVAFWLRRLLHLTRTSTGAATVLTDFVVHDRAELTVLPEVAYRKHGDGGLRAEVTAAGALASARPASDPTPADIVAWMRVVDANRAGRHRMRIIAPAAFYDQLRCRQLEYGPRLRVLRGIATGTDTAIGLFDAAELSRTATLDGCLQLLAATIYDELPAGVVPLPIGMDSAWLSSEPNRTVLEAHAFLRERTSTELIGDVIGTDQHGVPCLAFSGVRIQLSEQDSPARVAVAPCHAYADRAAPFRQETWEPRDLESVGLAGSANPIAQRALVIGESDFAVQLAELLDGTMPTDLIAREPETASPLVTTLLAASTGSAPTAVVLVWPTGDRSSARASGTRPEGSAAATVGRVLALLQRARADERTASLTIVLPEPIAAPVPHTDDPDYLAVPAAIAGLVRSLQLESDRVVRLVWADADTRNLPPLCRLVAAGTSDTSRLLAEIRLSAGDLAIRRFTAARLRPTPKATIDTNGTYVVTGGLGAVGAVAVRWLLDAGARDVVVLTRAPRPVPPLLDGLEDRIVVVRCDAADRADLANALNDIRHCGSTIRGLVHAAGSTVDAAFDAATPDQVARMLSPKLTAAGNLIELTAADPTDFILLFSAATGALGGQDQAAYAAANAAMDSLALTYPGRGVLSIGWGAWAVGSQEAAPHLRRAGVTAFDTLRGGALLSEALRYEGTYLCAVEYTPDTDSSPLAVRLSDLLAPAALGTRVVAVHTSEGP
ncbi:type I polyketide synthase [Nocardia iowensis]|uniref:SDR family NAD(P)-dependent oxidoreductase n=1 Tax=Nocardia iowensis TaxID=204891 RepID=A0ABX8RPK3_NOCIO|nr:type I polyketide synthase [Nocardia iowensis]QXN91568.1 SDR family NAD(P)-dependent oxidoreductase [Nocardia iowensis]